MRALISTRSMASTRPTKSDDLVTGLRVAVTTLTGVAAGAWFCWAMAGAATPRRTAIAVAIARITNSSPAPGRSVQFGDVPLLCLEPSQAGCRAQIKPDGVPAAVHQSMML